jgi:FKBP-type peptidyl-prolyl cis-trans isomerase
MNTKTLIIGIIVIILIAAGLYFIVKSPTAAAPTTTTTTTTTGTTANASSSTQVQAQDVTVGTGTQATPGTNVSVLYVGYLGTISTSTVFDSSAAHGNQPFTFTLGGSGSGSPIPGFQIGVNGMKVGGERLMAIPPSLGYGATGVKDANGNVIIPGNSTIIFDVKLVSVTAGSSTAATPTVKTTAKTTTK